MTVSELIEILREQPEGLRVVVNGYEDGYDDLTPEQIKVTSIGLNTGKHHYEGAHGEPADAKDAADVVEAVLLQRTSN